MAEGHIIHPVIANRPPPTWSEAEWRWREHDEVMRRVSREKVDSQIRRRGIMIWPKVIS